jgi:minor extracellular serine protease Vpr
LFKRILLLPLGILLAVAFAAAGTAGMRAESDGGSTAPTVDQGSALVELKGEPLATAEKTKPAKGKKLDLASNASRSYRAELNALRNDFKQWLRQNAPQARVTGEYDIALNAVAVELNGTSLDTIQSAPQVVSATTSPSIGRSRTTIRISG